LIYRKEERIWKTKPNRNRNRNGKAEKTAWLFLMKSDGLAASFVLLAEAREATLFEAGACYSAENAANKSLPHPAPFCMVLEISTSG